MTSPSIVRPAVSNDADEIWRLFRLLHAENAMFSISDRKVNYYLDRFLHPKNIHKDDPGPRGFIGVIGPHGALEGAIMIVIGQPWYSDDWSLDEYLNFVDPAHRRSNHAKVLIGYAKNVVDQLLPEYPSMKLIIGILSTIRTAAKIRLYKQSMQPTGAFFIHPPWAAASAEPLRRLYKGN